MASIFLLLNPPTLAYGIPSPHSYPDSSLGGESLTYLPIISSDSVDLQVNPKNREESRAFFNYIYKASEGYYINWTGNHHTCSEGITSRAFRYAVRLRVNYFRAMAGVPADVKFLDECNHKAQAAALMMSVNDQLSHTPDTNWTCYSDHGDEAAGSSNLFYGYNGWDAVEGYIKEPGSNNYAVGHRRWVLYPQTQYMGTGDIPAAAGHEATNSLWIFDEHLWTTRPKTRDGFVAWPPPGYVPYQIVFPRWSLSYGNADFSSASVAMVSQGKQIPVHVQPIVNGYGENTIVWEPELGLERPPPADRSYLVAVSDVLINGVMEDFVYEVIIFDPGTETTENTQAAPEVLLGIPLQMNR